MSQFCPVSKSDFVFPKRLNVRRIYLNNKLFSSSSQYTYVQFYYPDRDGDR